MPNVSAKTLNARLYPDQLEVWEQIRGDISDAEMVRRVIKFYCDQHGIDFPMYETHGRGGVRRGKDKVEATPII